MEYPSGTQLFVSPDSDTAIEEAKRYIKEHAYTTDEVKLIRTEGQIRVVKR